MKVTFVLLATWIEGASYPKIWSWEAALGTDVRAFGGFGIQLWVRETSHAGTEKELVETKMEGTKSDHGRSSLMEKTVDFMAHVSWGPQKV